MSQVCFNASHLCCGPVSRTIIFASRIVVPETPFLKAKIVVLKSLFRSAFKNGYSGIAIMEWLFQNACSGMVILKAFSRMRPHSHPNQNPNPPPPTPTRKEEAAYLGWRRRKGTKEESWEEHHAVEGVRNVGGGGAPLGKEEPSRRREVLGLGEKMLIHMGNRIISSPQHFGSRHKIFGVYCWAPEWPSKCLLGGSQRTGWDPFCTDPGCTLQKYLAFWFGAKCEWGEEKKAENNNEKGFLVLDSERNSKWCVSSFLRPNPN